MFSTSIHSAALASLEVAPYRLESVVRAKAPAGLDGDGWHRYVITQGPNEIVGHRQGTLESVTAAVEQVVASLNERRGGKTGRVHLTRKPRASD